MSYKSIIFFAILFGIIIFGYLCYDTFTKYFPIHIVFKVGFLIVGVGAVLFPHIFEMLRDNESTDTIKDYLIDKYKTKI